MPPSLFPAESPVSQRQPKTDRLFLARYIDDEATKTTLDAQAIAAGHAVLVKWADLETSGRLVRLNETQMQGDFLAEVFGGALAFAGPIDGASEWQRLQHQSIAGDTPDAILGHFATGVEVRPLVVVELKGPRVNLDRDRSGGRTAVDQCWHYLNNTPPECRWGIVSNYVSFRLYERNSTKRRYEHFTLQSLRDPAEFRRFYVLFHREGLIAGKLSRPPRAVALLARSAERQREVSDALFDAYSTNRTSLIAHLHFELKHPLGLAIEMAQRLFDRIMFIAFCEDRGLLPEKSIQKARSINGFYAVTNPRWQNFKNLFRFIDAGSTTHAIHRYNGGLFAPHGVDELDLPDEPWTNFFQTVAGFDFADEVNLDVLGHLFERSITELEKLKESGLFGGNLEKAQEFAQMPQSAKRKRLGIYYTPEELTLRIVQYTVDELIDERFVAAAVAHGVRRQEAERGAVPPTAEFWRECLGILRNLKVLDPACGSGAFLFQAYNVLEQRYLEVIGHLEQAGDPDAESLAAQVPHFILGDNLYGVDLSPEAVEIAQLALWIRSATPGQTLAPLSRNVVLGNSLVHDPEVHPEGFDWPTRFPEVFHREEAGFDCVIGNPPWERIKLQEREFFSLPAPEIATATNAAKRRTLIARLAAEAPALHARYLQALDAAGSLLDYCRKSKAYPLTGRGDINTYAVFAELAYRLVAPHGRVGLLVPSGIASDNTTKDFFAAIAESNRLIRLFDFENKKVFFPEVHASFKFCILNFSGAQSTTDEADYVFFVHRVEELEDRKRHVALSAADIALVNPNTRTCPIFRSERDARITKAIYRRVPVLIDRRRTGPTSNPWHITFRRMFDQTNDAELFEEAAALKHSGAKPVGNRWKKGKKVWLPLYEAKMIQAYDHRAANVVTDQANWVRQGQTEKTDLVHHQNPEHLALPRSWVSQDAVTSTNSQSPGHFLCIKDVTSPTNQRTMIGAFIPFVGVVNSAPIIRAETSARSQCCLLANLNSYTYDFVLRQKISNVHLNFFIVEQIATLPPDEYSKPCPWDHASTLEAWISHRVLKLTCTAEDMLPLADACGFISGSFQAEYGGRLNKWDEAERAELMADLDAAYFHLYGIGRDDAEYILSTFKGIHDRRTLFPGHCTTAEYILRKYAEMSFPA